jgi:hypothetical protein
MNGSIHTELILLRVTMHWASYDGRSKAKSDLPAGIDQQNKE